MDSSTEIIIRPVGQVRNGINEKMQRGWSRVESELVIDPGLTDLLDGLQNFSHIIVLYWMHKSAGQFTARVHPRGISDVPLTGVFATRAPHRPNAFGMAVSELLERRDNELTVRGLDAINGTPIIDIKPYLPKDVIPEAKHPDWVSRLDFT